MADLRQGIYGSYYGTLFSESEPLTESEMKVNATYICIYLLNKGWTKYAIAGMLGNMQAESSLNPGRWQSEDVGNTNLGYGLVQWTPATKYLDWCSNNNLSDPSEMDNNLARIIYELENNLQWIATSEYSFSFKQFSQSTTNARDLASAFLKCYERAGVEVEETRRMNANNWFIHIEKITKDDTSGVVKPGSGIKRKKGKFKFILFNRNRRII